MVTELGRAQGSTWPNTNNIVKDMIRRDMASRVRVGGRSQESSGQ